MAAAERWIPYRVPDFVDLLAAESPDPDADEEPGTPADSVSDARPDPVRADTVH